MSVHICGLEMVVSIVKNIICKAPKKFIIFAVLIQAMFAQVRPSDSFPSGDALVMAEAIQTNNFVVVNNLLGQKRINPNSEGRLGMTFLVWAAQTKSRPSFDALLKSGANPNYIDAYGTPSIVALSRAPARGETEVDDLYFLQSALRAGGDPNAEDAATGWNALMTACTANGSVERIQLLLDRGANPNQRSKKFGDTLLMHCIRLFQFDKILVLLTRGADYRQRDNRGQSFLDLMRKNLEPSGFQERDKHRNKVILFLKNKGVSLK